MNKLITAVCVVVASVLIGCSAQAKFEITTALEATIKADIVTEFKLTGGWQVPCNPCKLGDTIGALVRLAFHDASGQDKRYGCVDLLDGDNNGLQTIHAQVVALKAAKSWGSKVSFGDLIQFCAIVAMEYATLPPNGPELVSLYPTEYTLFGPFYAWINTRAGQPPLIPIPSFLTPVDPFTQQPVFPYPGLTWKCSSPPACVNPLTDFVQDTIVPTPLKIKMLWGRTDYLYCKDAGEFPPPSLDFAGMVDFFKGKFKMTIEETVAIQGGHAVGRCEFANTGFEGGWSPFQAELSAGYFFGFGAIPGFVKWNNTNESLVYVDSVPPFGNNLLMLKTDIELIFDTNIKIKKGQSVGDGSGYCDNFATIGFGVENSGPFPPPSDCPYQDDAADVVFEYVGDISGFPFNFGCGNGKFFRDFSTAWTKMVTVDTKDLHIAGDLCDLFYPVVKTTAWNDVDNNYRSWKKSKFDEIGQIKYLVKEAYRLKNTGWGYSPAAAAVHMMEEHAVPPRPAPAEVEKTKKRLRTDV